jgi:hypothetical protein
MASAQDLTIDAVCSGAEFPCPRPECPGRVVALGMRTLEPPDNEPACTVLCSIRRDGRVCCSHLQLVEVEQE